MGRQERSLRMVAEKWLGCDGLRSARVTRLRQGTGKRRRYVCIATERAGDTFFIFFFRQDNRSWSVFPPLTERPTMAIAESLGWRDCIQPATERSARTRAHDAQGDRKNYF